MRYLLIRCTVREAILTLHTLGVKISDQVLSFVLASRKVNTLTLVQLCLALQHFSSCEHKLIDFDPRN